MAAGALVLQEDLRAAAAVRAPPTRLAIRSDAWAAPYTGSTPGIIAHHVPARSSLPTRPDVVEPSTQYCTAGPSGVSSDGARNTTLKLGRGSDRPTYRAPICSRTLPPEPSHPST